ncbi:hypothetical protein D3C76_985470 [compost metagenome]
MQCAGTDQYRHFSSSVEYIRGTLQVLLERHHAGPAVADAGMHRAVGFRWFVVGQVLQVVGQDDGGDPAFADGGTYGAIEQVAHLFRGRSLLDEGTCDVLEHRQQVQLLLVMPAKRRSRLLTDDGQHRLVIHARVIQAGKQM